jgi:thymidylate synthase (FAD)
VPTYSPARLAGVAVTAQVIPDNTIPVLDHGFVRLDDAMADDLSVANGARVSFARRKDELDESDEGLIRFLMRERHGTPFGKPGAYSFEPVSDELAEATRDKLRAVYETAYLAYEQLVELGVARELARTVLPVGAYTEFYWTVNARSLMNFLSLRNSETAQREIRRYAEACERFLEEKMPVTYAAFVANDRTAP